MAKATGNAAAQIEGFIKRSLADLKSRREALLRQVKAIDNEMAMARIRAIKELGGVPGEPFVPDPRLKGRRFPSMETRQKMAAAARRRWAKARKAGKRSLS